MGTAIITRPRPGEDLTVSRQAGRFVGTLRRGHHLVARFVLTSTQAADAQRGESIRVRDDQILEWGPNAIAARYAASPSSMALVHEAARRAGVTIETRTRAHRHKGPPTIGQQAYRVVDRALGRAVDWVSSRAGHSPDHWPVRYVVVQVDWRGLRSLPKRSYKTKKRAMEVARRRSRADLVANAYEVHVDGNGRRVAAYRHGELVNPRRKKRATH